MSFMAVEVVDRMRKITRGLMRLAVETRLYHLAASSREVEHALGCP